VRFRHRVGPVRVPASLASGISAVLGLDNRPQAQPRFRQQDAVAAPHAFTTTQVAALYHFPAGDGTGRTVDILELGGASAAPISNRPASTRPS